MRSLREASGCCGVVHRHTVRCKIRRAWPWLLAALLVLPALCLSRAAGAEEETPIDCSATPFVFSGDGYFVDCLRVDARASADGASGASQSDLISITSGERSMFLTVVSRRLTAVRLYMRRRDLRENTRDFLSIVELKEWKGIGNKAGYDMAEFDAEISGQPSHCLALQRYLNPIDDGYKRHVIGIGCTSGSLEPVYEALAKLRAPGD